jgi:hypothetical protein
MDLFRYISEVYKLKLYEKTHLTNREFEFFYRNIVMWELDNGPFSVYQIYNNMSNRGENMAYKNVHQKLQKLYSQGLLGGAEYHGRSIHGAKFYKVSSKGWFILIVNASLIQPLSSIASTISKAIQKYYSSNIIFDAIICPYFNLESIRILVEQKMLLEYLSNCCQSTVDVILSRSPDGREISIDNFMGLIRSDRGAPTDSMLGLEERIVQAIDVHIRSFIIKLILSLSRHPAGKYSYLSAISSQLASDDKFMNIFYKVEKEFSTNIKHIKRPYYHKNRG